MEKFEKDILTTENIISDFKFISLYQQKSAFLSLIIVVPILILLIYLIVELPDIIILKTLLILALIFFVIVLIAAIITFIDYPKGVKTLTHQRFEISIDKLIDKEEETAPPLLHSTTVPKPNILKFKKFGKYCIPECVNYSSSKQFAMREIEVFRSSKIDDEFYLIIDDKKNILIVYNTKFFQLQEQ